jgi:hypothetical protein
MAAVRAIVKWGSNPSVRFEVRFADSCDLARIPQESGPGRSLTRGAATIAGPGCRRLRCGSERRSDQCLRRIPTPLAGKQHGTLRASASLSLACGLRTRIWFPRAAPMLRHSSQDGTDANAGHVEEKLLPRSAGHGVVWFVSERDQFRQSPRGDVAYPKSEELAKNRADDGTAEDRMRRSLRLHRRHAAIRFPTCV